MDEMIKRRNGRNRVFYLFYEIKDHLSDLEGINNDGSKHLKELKNSVKTMSAEFKELLPIVNTEKDELESIKKLRAEIQEALT